MSDDAKHDEAEKSEAASDAPPSEKDASDAPAEATAAPSKTEAAKKDDAKKNDAEAQPDVKDLLALPEKVGGWRDHALGALLGGAYVAWLLATARSLGFARDEGFYFRAAQSYARWFDLLVTKPKQAFDRGTIDGIWGENHEHPSLMKSLFALSWSQFHEKWHLFDDASTSFRFPGMCMAGLAVWVTYLFAARAYSRRAGVVAAMLLAAMPRVFYNAHLACFDVGIMTMWLVSVYVYWRAEQEKGLGWALAAGVVYGLALDTKHNAWILPAVFVSHAVVLHGRSIARYLKVGRLQLPTTLVSIAVVGPLVFLALWPWMWSDTSQRVQDYLSFHLNHEYYNMEFLGRNYFGPPSPPSYAPVMIAATVPSITLLLFFVGAFDRARAGVARASSWARSFAKKSASAPEASPADDVPRDRTQTDLLLALSFAAPLAVFFLPKTPIFGGTKHWLPAYPFLAIFAGRGFDLAARAGERALSLWTKLAADKRALFASRFPLVLGALVVLAPLAVTAHSHPFGLSSYVPLVGGTAGGADLGLNRQFWGFTTESVAPYLDQAARTNASVFIHDTAWDSWARLQDEGRIRHDLRAVGSPSEADFSLVHHELHMNEVDYQIWVAYGTVAPAYVLRQDGVPIVSVYKRP